MKNKKNNMFEKIYGITRKIPYGKVATYGQIAVLAGNPKLSRVVGYAMSFCPYRDVPCHRVVNRFGELAKNFGENGSEEQKVRLKNEGIDINESNCVNLRKYIWNVVENEV
ncbi:MGMT family protein [Leptotrichia sp. OH3620_COT-345]|uniref:MGMT family protein n=1 Tax=Leptotrichia sp. OH3620_COT-345 TaxID=2491048 RepID=UPI000F64FD43|nr:MGMT family protein [Leptotrichia sp. OH3620_COT-345]RRD38750.1 MGMT family protein [Leptotrichia sp. OH3620_COT-345]